MSRGRRAMGWVIAALAIGAAPAGAQAPVRISFPADTIRAAVGDTLRLAAVATDAAGNVVPADIQFFGSGGLPLDRDGTLVPDRGGEYRVVAFIRGGTVPPARAVVSIAFPPVRQVEVTGTTGRHFVGASSQLSARVIDAADAERPELGVEWQSTDPAVASVTRGGMLTGHRAGRTTLRATAGGVRGERAIEVVENPIRSVTMSLSATDVRTGDVVHATVRALDAGGRPLEGVPVRYAVIGTPDDSVVAAGPTAEVDARGRFVAERPGRYTILADAAGHAAQAEVWVAPRQVSRRITSVGQGPVRGVHTSDLWVWTGADGRDYAVTGTWSAAGAAYFWDVTDPAAPVLTDSIVVDARTVNDVKVSEDGRVCVISREGASDRRNGIVILDCTDPRQVSVLSTFDDELTGGVHNVFIYRDHVYAVNNGRRYDIINIEDPRHPRRVGRFELDTPGHALHDVWVVDGIAYSSNWQDGVVLVDVGNGVAGGSPANPVEIARYRDVGGATHAAFPYRSPTGRTYVFMGDEIGADNMGPTIDGEPAPRTPEAMAGYIHVVDFTDPEHPEEVARYEVPEAGSHNFWVEDDVLYAAFYNGGTRVVDVSGELKGNLGRQGREIARFMAYDPDSFIPNAPMSWGPQPHKGHLFIAEHYSGLWAVRVGSPEPPTP